MNAMQNPPDPVPTETGSNHTPPTHLAHTLSLAAALVLIPALLGVLAMLAFQKFNPRPRPPAAGVAEEMPFTGGTDTVERLTLWRRDLRHEGLPIEEANLRIWAARATKPEILFRIAPPAPNQSWLWFVTQDGLHALAVSRQIDVLERHTVGLCDLITTQWVWTVSMRWPECYAQPAVIGGHTLVRYAANGQRFAMELSPKGQILNLDALGQGMVEVWQPPPPQTRFPGTPVAVTRNVFFAADEESGSLLGYAIESLPGLRYAGKGDAHTVCSGNGLLIFRAREGRITVTDTLTQTVLAEYNAWRHTPDTAVTATLASPDGSQFTVFLLTRFPGEPPVEREWCVILDLPEGRARPFFHADALSSRPQPPADPLQTISPDGRWCLSLTEGNVLRIAAGAERREWAHCALAPLTGVRQPFDALTFLDEGRHVLLRQRDNLWLLDFATARQYADLLARIHASDAAVASGVVTEPVTNAYDTFPMLPDRDATRTPADSARLALHAERCAANQAWFYAAALLDASLRHPVWEGRTPSANRFMLARYHILAGQHAAARRNLLIALKQLDLPPTLGSSPVNDAPLMRFHLQRLLQALPSGR